MPDVSSARDHVLKRWKTSELRRVLGHVHTNGFDFRRQAEAEDLARVSVVRDAQVGEERSTPPMRMVQVHHVERSAWPQHAPYFDQGRDTTSRGKFVQAERAKYDVEGVDGKWQALRVCSDEADRCARGVRSSFPEAQELGRQINSSDLHPIGKRTTCVSRPGAGIQDPLGIRWNATSEDSVGIPWDSPVRPFEEGAREEELHPVRQHGNPKLWST
jgi:hypothetical protein